MLCNAGNCKPACCPKAGDYFMVKEALVEGQVVAEQPKLA